MVVGLRVAMEGKEGCGGGGEGVGRDGQRGREG